MFFSMIYWVYILVALLPAIFLMRYVYLQDKIEKEPGYLLLNLVILGAVSAVIAGLLELIGEAVLSSLMTERNPYYKVLTAFLVVGAAEEGVKFFFLKKRTWRDPNFNFRFDGVVYAAFVSLGFAAFENVMYVFKYGLTTGFLRAFLSVPGHLGFSVFMGTFYGHAKSCELDGNESRKRFNLWAGYLTAVFLHGFYDACVMLKTSSSMLVFFAFVIAMYIICFRLIRSDSASDGPV
jgi:RsiW-degrading membrane proteinase PrsW (M82 family)